MTARVDVLGRALIAVGLVIAVLGAVLAFGPRLPLLGHLPGDITIQRGDVTVFLPIGTMVVVSVLASILLSLVGRR